MGTAHSKDVPVAQCERNLKWSLQHHVAWCDRASLAKHLLGDGAPRFHGSAGQVLEQARAALAEVDRLMAPETSSTQMSNGSKPTLAQQLSGGSAHTASSSGASHTESSAANSAGQVGAGSSADPFSSEQPVALPLSHPAHQCQASQFFGAAATKDIVLAHTQHGSSNGGATTATMAAGQKTPPQDIHQLTNWTRGRLERVHTASRLDLSLPGGSSTASSSAASSRESSPRNSNLVTGATGSLATNPHLPLSTSIDPFFAGRSNAQASRGSGSYQAPGMYDTVAAGRGNTQGATYPLGTGLAGLPGESITSQLGASESRGVPTGAEDTLENHSAPSLAAATTERIELVSKYLFIAALLEKMIASAQTSYGLSTQIESLRKAIKPKRTKTMHPDTIRSMRINKEEHELLLRDNMQLFFKSRLTLQWFYTDFNLCCALHLLHDTEVAAKSQRDRLQEAQYVKPTPSEPAIVGADGRALPESQAVLPSEEQRLQRERINSSYALQNPGTFATPASHPTQTQGQARERSNSISQGAAGASSNDATLQGLNNVLLGIEHRRSQVELRLQANERTALSIAHYYLSRHSEGTGLRMSDAPDFSPSLFKLLDTTHSQRVTREQLQTGLCRLSEAMDSLHARIRALQMHNESLASSAPGAAGGQSSNMLASNALKIQKLSAELTATTGALKELNYYFLGTFVRNVFVNLAPEEMPGEKPRTAAAAATTATASSVPVGTVSAAHTLPELHSANLDAQGLLADLGTLSSQSQQVLNPLDVGNEGRIGPDEILSSKAPIATGLPMEHVTTTVEASQAAEEERREDAREAMRESGELPSQPTVFGAQVQPQVQKAIEQAQVAPPTQQPEPIVEQKPIEEPIQQQQLQQQPPQQFEQPLQIQPAVVQQSQPPAAARSGSVGGLLQRFKQIEETNLKNHPEVAQKTINQQKQQQQKQEITPPPAAAAPAAAAVVLAPVAVIAVQERPRAAAAPVPEPQQAPDMTKLHRATSRPLPRLPPSSDRVVDSSLRSGVPTNSALAPVLAPEDLREGEHQLHHVPSGEIKPSMYGGQHDRSMLPPALGSLPSDGVAVNAGLAPVVEPRALDAQAHHLAHVPLQPQNYTATGGITMHPEQQAQQMQQTQPTSHPVWSEPAGQPALVMDAPPAVLASSVVTEAPPTRINGALAETIDASDLRSQKRSLDRVVDVVPSQFGGVHGIDAQGLPIDRAQLQAHSHELHHVPIEKAPTTASGGVHLIDRNQDHTVVPSQVSARAASNVALAQAIQPTELAEGKKHLDAVTGVQPSQYGGVHDAEANLPIDAVALQYVKAHDLTHVPIEKAPVTASGGVHLIDRDQDYSVVPSQVSARAASNVALAGVVQPKELASQKRQLDAVTGVQPSQYGGVHDDNALLAAGPDRVAIQYVKAHELQHVPIEKAPTTASGGVHLIDTKQDYSVVPSQVSAMAASNVALAQVVQPQDLRYEKRALEHVSLETQRPTLSGGVHMNDESAHVKLSLMDRVKSVLGMETAADHMEAPGLGRVVEKPSPRPVAMQPQQAALPITRPPAPRAHDLQVESLKLHHVNIGRVEMRRDLAAGVGCVTTRKATPPRAALKRDIVADADQQQPFEPSSHHASISRTMAPSAVRKSSPATVFGEKDDDVVSATTGGVSKPPGLPLEDQITKELWSEQSTGADPRQRAIDSSLARETQIGIRPAMQQPPHEQMGQ